MFLKNRKIFSKIKRSKVTDYAALSLNGKKLHLEIGFANFDHLSVNFNFETLDAIFICDGFKCISFKVIKAKWLNVILEHRKQALNLNETFLCFVQCMFWLRDKKINS